jgi:phosphonoacetate hydrolase
MHAAQADESQANLATLDRLLDALLNSGPEFATVVTADHGMAAKTHGLELGQILASAGIAAEAVPIIKDRYVAHHQNLGGAAYVFLEDLTQVDEATGLLLAERGVESVWTRDQAAAEFQLYPDRIGDLFVLACQSTVFGDLPWPRGEVAIRSHGGLHTRSVPIIAHGPGLPVEPLNYNYQAANWIEW